MNEREIKAREIGDAIEELLGEDEGFVLMLFPFNQEGASIDLVTNAEESGLIDVLQGVIDGTGKTFDPNLKLH